VRVLTVNAGSTSLKRHIVEGGQAQAVDGYAIAEAVGHRVVHGGELRQPALIDAEVERLIRAASAVAPLHNRPAITALADARATLPNVPHVAVFDSGFHATLLAEAATYAVPPEWGIGRLGFHGLSVAWAASQVRVARLVVCHLGGGCSVTAVRDGRSVDTTMGYTPLDGVPMATRAGAVDPGALLHLLRSGRLTLEELDDGLEHRSGLLALGGSARVEELEAAGDERAELALEVFCHRVAAAVAACTVALQGLDAVAFTAGVGERSSGVRSRICERLRHLGVELDDERNRRGDPEIAAAGSAVAVHVVPAREELVIADAVQSLLRPPQ
jgi:acetate kinase